MKELNRRDILYGLGGLGLWSLVGFHGSTAPAGPAGFLVGGDGKDFVLIDLRDLSLTRVSTPTIGHSFMVWPHQPGCFLGVEKNGDSLSLVDFKSRKLIQSVKSVSPRRFYGHLALSPSGDEIFSSQVDTVTGEGAIVIYDSKTLKPKGDLHRTAGGLHDLALLPANPGVLVHTSSGVKKQYAAGEKKPSKAVRAEKSALVYFDVAKKKIIETQALDDESMICGHLKPLTGERVAVVTTPFEEYTGPKRTAAGSLYLSRRGAPLKELALPAALRRKLDDEFLSLAFDRETETIAVTNPKGRHVLIYDGKKEAFERALPASSLGAAFEPSTHKLFLSVRRGDPELAPVPNLAIGDLGRVNPLTSSHFLFVASL